MTHLNVLQFYLRCLQTLQNQTPQNKSALVIVVRLNITQIIQDLISKDVYKYMDPRSHDRNGDINLKRRR
jgi:hypothetical protein